jgi:hypothetical protein
MNPEAGTTHKPGQTHLLGGIIPAAGVVTAWLRRGPVRACHGQHRRFEAPQAVALGGRDGGGHACHQRIEHVLEVGLQEVRALLADVGKHLVALFLHRRLLLLREGREAGDRKLVGDWARCELLQSNRTPAAIPQRACR